MDHPEGHLIQENERPMKLSNKVLTKLAEMICGASGCQYKWNAFPYRTGGGLVEFFDACELEGFEGGGTRKWDTLEFLKVLNDRAARHPSLPSSDIVVVIRELMHDDNYTMEDTNRDEAITQLNQVLSRDAVRVVPTDDGLVQVQSTSTGTVSGVPHSNRRAWRPEEVRRRSALAGHLDSLSEDAFTETVLVPVLRELGFLRVSTAGHRDKALEYGKDLWMKHPLPTGHWLYFGLQVKIGKVDASGRSAANVAELLNQTKMMLGHEVFDPETNRRVLVDHVYLVSSGTITKQARNWLGQRLDAGQRRSVMFIDREDILDLAVGTAVHIPGFDANAGRSTVAPDNQIPY